MGMFDKLRSFFRGENNTAQQVPTEDPYKKSMLATQIVNLVDKIKRINSFDSSIWNLNVSKYALERKSLAELEQIQSSLERRYQELTDPQKVAEMQKAAEREEINRAAWVGHSEKYTSEEIDRYQRGND